MIAITAKLLAALRTRFMVHLSSSESHLVSVSISRLEALNRAENLDDSVMTSQCCY